MGRAKICDRCKTYYEAEYRQRFRLVRYLDEMTNRSNYRSRNYTLCPACEKQLAAWFDGGADENT